MPQVGWIDSNGEKWSHKEMVDYASTYPTDFPYTPEMLEGMFRHSERDYMSPTTLAGCPRQEVLKRSVDYYVEVTKAWAAYRGTMAHLMLEHGTNESGAIVETRYDLNLELPDGDVVLLRGQPDKLVPASNGDGWILIDYKTVSEIKTTPKKSWISQLSSYAYLLHHHGMEITRGIIMQVSMDGPTSTELNLWSLQETEAYLLSRIKRFRGVYNGLYDIDNLPPILDFTLDDNGWLCIPLHGQLPWCPVWAECQALAKRGK